MDSFTVNKIAGAVLGTCLVGVGIGIIGQEIFSPAPPKKPGYELPKGEAAGGSETAPGAVPLPVLLSKADAKRGEKDVKVCGACHNLNEGGGTKIGPDLYGVVDRDKGSVAGFDYSAGMKAKGGKWTFSDLNEFLTKPSAYVSGTKMGYPGEENAEKRADILAYLASNAKTPVPLPKPSDADKKAAAGGGKTAEAAKPAEGAAGGGGDIVKLIASADPKAGEKDATVCKACHTVNKGGATLVGPNLYGVVDRDKGSEKGFDYSAGLKAKGGKWTYADLNTWLTKPASYVQGTKMGYPGEANEKKRAAIIAYLRTLADKPAPLDGGDAKAAPAADKATDAKKPDDKMPVEKKETTSGDKAGASSATGDNATTPPAGDKGAAPPPAAAPKPDEKKETTPPAGDKAAAPPPPAPASKPDDQKKTEAAPPRAAAPEQKAQKAEAPSDAKSEEAADRGPQPYDSVDPIIVSDPVAPASKTIESGPAESVPVKADPGDASGAPDTAPEPYSAPAPDDADKT